VTRLAIGTLFAAPILVMTSLGWGGGGLGPRDPEWEAIHAELLDTMEDVVALQLRFLDRLETHLTSHDWQAHMEYENWLLLTNTHLWEISGGTAEHLRVTDEQMRDYYDRHEAPMDAARAILIDLNFPTDLLTERTQTDDD
jgi:hypothetical protein